MRKMGLVVVAVTLCSALGATGLGPELVECSDQRGCPDLVTDSASLVVGTQRTETFAPSHCAVQEGSVEPGVRQLIRVSFTFGNAGLGDVNLGAPAENPDWFEWATCHNHYHVKEHATFRLWTPEGYTAWDELRNADPDATADEMLAAHPELDGDYVLGKKQGFCMISQEPLPPTLHGLALTIDPIPDHNDIHGDVCAGFQGQDPGWADTYAFFQDGMWVDVTDLASGAYILEGEMNSNHFIRELSYANNRAAVPIAVLDQSGPEQAPFDTPEDFCNVLTFTC